MKVYICHPPKKGWPIYNFWDKNYLAIVIAVGQINLVSFLKKHWRKGNSLVILHLKIWRKSQVMETLMEISMEAGNTWADACSHLYLNMKYIHYTYKTDIEAILDDALMERLVTFKGWGLISHPWGLLASSSCAPRGPSASVSPLVSQAKSITPIKVKNNSMRIHRLSAVWSVKWTQQCFMFSSGELKMETYIYIQKKNNFNSKRRWKGLIHIWNEFALTPSGHLDFDFFLPKDSFSIIQFVSV